MNTTDLLGSGGLNEKPVTGQNRFLQDTISLIDFLIFQQNGRQRLGCVNKIFRVDSASPDGISPI